MEQQELPLSGKAIRRREPRYNGPEYVPERDFVRLHAQTARVLAVIRCGEWMTIAEVADSADCPENSASAQLRHLRKRRFGSHIILRRHKGGGLFEYRYGGISDEGHP
jgi:hypothetical protein